MITGIGWDHPDIYPTREDYNQAFRTFIDQSQSTFIWSNDAEQLPLERSANVHIQYSSDYKGMSTLVGKVNRADACLVARACLELLDGQSISQYMRILVGWRFDGGSKKQVAPGLYSDYAHTPEKIRGALQLGHEVASENLVVV